MASICCTAASTPTTTPGSTTRSRTAAAASSTKASSPAVPGPERPVAAGATPIARRVERGKRGAGMSTAREMTTTATWAPGSAAFDVERIRTDFPILQQRVHGKPLVYLDNAATSQKPRVVIDTVERYYAAQNANIHRGVHFLSEQATAAYEDARRTVARFLHAADPREIIFVRGATEGINLVAQSYGRAFFA